MKSLYATLAVSLIGAAVLVLGCGTSQARPSNTSTGSQKQTVTNNGATENTGSKSVRWQEVGMKDVEIEGTIKNVIITSGTLESLRLDVVKDIQVANPSPAACDFSGKTVTIVFDQKMSNAAQLTSHLEKGASIVLNFAQFAIPPKGKVVYGASFAGTYYKVNGQVYNLHGKAVDVHNPIGSFVGTPS